MHNNKSFFLGLSLAGTFIMGCLAQPMLMPAHAGVAAQEWEYLCIHENFDVEGNRAGAEGWELVTATHVPAIQGDGWSKYCFKRPL